MADTVSFWDCGEFAACSYTLAVPHPPGSPLFLLIGRVFSMLPFSSDIGVRVTWISVLASAFSILLAYLIIVRLIRHIRGIEQTAMDKVITYGGAIVGSLTLSWSYSMWFNAVESEVYALSQFFTHITVWLILVWYEKADEPGNERYLLLIAYMMGLSTGVHLLNILTLPALAMIVYFRRKKFQLGSFVGMAAITGLLFVLIYPGVVKWLPGLASRVNLWAPFIAIGAVAAVFWWATKNRHGVISVASAGVLLIVVSYSSYGMIFIRSSLNPGIDENDPDTPAKFLSYLNREQYGERDMFPRVWNNSPEYKSETDFFWRYQVNKMFNRYLFWQFIGREGAPEREFQDAGVQPNYSLLSLISNDPQGLLRWLAVVLCFPFLLGLLGLVYQFTKDKTGWVFVATLFALTGYAVILYLNQDDPQPRERDYSYVGAFFAFALWIGIGAASVIEWVTEKIKALPSKRTAAIAATAALVLFSPVIMLARNYEMQDRSGNYVAWDYSYNMLMSCAPDGILFTNGDNDTFPVWYLQEVEGVRRDVRIVNLSLLNTGWYIKQLKHRDPKVPISFNDPYIDRYLDGHDAQAILSRYWPPEKQRIDLNTPEGKMSWSVPAAMYVPYKQDESRQPNFLRVQDVMILDILRTNYDPAKTPKPKPIYFAVTVANSNMIGLRDYLTMEGLVFRINPRGRQSIDPVILERHLFETFNGHFRGIDQEDVHYDDNISKLLQNYRSAFLQLAYHYSTLPDPADLKPANYESLSDRITNFDKLANRDKALTLMEMMDQKIPESVRPISNPELSAQLGRMYADLGKPEEFRRRLEMASQRDDLRLETRARLASFWISTFNDTAEARKLIEGGIGPNPTGEAYYNVGTQLFSGGAYVLAADYFERAYNMNPNDGQAIGALLQSYENSGQPQKALSTLEDWVARHPQDRSAKQRLDQMRQRLTADTTKPSAVN